MYYDRPVVMSIAGFDPSGGAGVLADVKTFEQQQCLGFGVLTAWTVQTENSLLKVAWLPLEKIKEQVTPLLDQYPVRVIKIGIMESLDTLLSLLQWLKGKQEDVLIVWDPVLIASTGFILTDVTDKKILESILEHVFITTPNRIEARQLSCNDDEKKGARYLSGYCHVLLKGGHMETALGTDILWTDYRETSLLPSGKQLTPKHGSGCILSSAIAANLAKGIPLLPACKEAKKYIETILGSNQNLLAYHYV